MMKPYSCSRKLSHRHMAHHPLTGSDVTLLHTHTSQVMTSCVRLSITRVYMGKVLSIVLVRHARWVHGWHRYHTYFLYFLGLSRYFLWSIEHASKITFWQFNISPMIPMMGFVQTMTSLCCIHSVFEPLVETSRTSWKEPTLWCRFVHSRCFMTSLDGHRTH